MAKALTPKKNGKDDGPTKGHNVGEVHKTIRSGFDALYKLDKEIEELTAKHVEPVKDQRKETWRHLKADTDITRKILELDYKKYKIAREAKEEREEDGPAILDSMAIAHEALHPGEVVDWVEVVDRVSAGV